MKHRIATCFLIMSTLYSGAAYCGDTTGVITEMVMIQTIADKVFVHITGTNTSQPSCSNSTANRYGLDTSTSTGKLLYSWLLAAKYAGATVMIWGSGNCALYSDSETMLGLQQP